MHPNDPRRRQSAPLKDAFWKAKFQLRISPRSDLGPERVGRESEGEGWPSIATPAQAAAAARMTPLRTAWAVGDADRKAVSERGKGGKEKGKACRTVAFITEEGHAKNDTRTASRSKTMKHCLLVAGFGTLVVDFSVWPSLISV